MSISGRLYLSGRVLRNWRSRTSDENFLSVEDFVLVKVFSETEGFRSVASIIFHMCTLCDTSSVLTLCTLRFVIHYMEEWTLDSYCRGHVFGEWREHADCVLVEKSEQIFLYNNFIIQVIKLHPCDLKIFQVSRMQTFPDGSWCHFRNCYFVLISHSQLICVLLVDNLTCGFFYMILLC